MAKPLKRTVRIRLTARSAKDPRSLLKAVEEAFRPKELQIDVVDSTEDQSTDDARLVAEEPLETEISREVAEHLDQKAQTEEPVPSDAPINDPTAPPLKVERVAFVRRKIRDFLKDLAWKVLVKIVADRVVELFFGFHSAAEMKNYIVAKFWDH